MQRGSLSVGMVSLALSGAASLACAQASPGVGVAVPGGWVVVPAPSNDNWEANCANWADTSWSVALSADSNALVIAPVRRLFQPTLQVDGGRLGADNHGEFGGSIWWEPAGAPKVILARGNLNAFQRFGPHILGLEGVQRSGRILSFARRAGRWLVDTLVSLQEAPYASTVLWPDTIIAATHSGIVMISGRSVRRAFGSRVWYLTYPNSVVRDRSGVVYVGMLSAVSRLTPTGGGFQEDWLVPASCPRRRPVPHETRCVCVPPS
jgi:hypothetical protein